jgi:hypothetical protein
MARRALDPKMRSIVLQSLLVGVFAASVGLAAVVTRWVRMSLRVELGEAKTVGRLVVRLPAQWLSSTSTVDRGEGVEAEEPPSEQQAGRRLKILRQRADGLIPPLEHLTRSGLVKTEVLKSLADGRDGFGLTNLPVAGWPGQMLTAVSSPRPGVMHKDVVACATLPGGQAVIVRLEGLGPVDAADRELVRQMCETVSLPSLFSPTSPATPEPAKSVELADRIRVDAPDNYLRALDDDPNDLQERLVYDGPSAGGSAWVAIDLASCVFFADDRDETFLAMLAARDPDWRSAAVRRPTPTTLVADRTDSAGQAFPARAGLVANADGRALLVVMRGGGPRDARLFDAAWQTVSGTARFEGSKDLSALLVNGGEAVRTLAARTLLGRVDPKGVQQWFLWDAAENADQELWSQHTWQVAAAATGAPSADPEVAGPPVASAVSAPDGITGARTSRPANPYAIDTEFEQQWSASVDLTRYQATTYREVRRGGTRMSRQTLEQRFTVDKGRLTLTSAGGPNTADAPLPTAFVPGAVAPLVMRQLAERPALLKTESFVGAETVAPAGLLTLFVTRLDDAPPRLDERGDLMECVTVSVNGTGQVSRWYYGPDQALRFIDFAGGLKAQTGTK